MNNEQWTMTNEHWTMKNEQGTMNNKLWAIGDDKEQWSMSVDE